MKKFWQNNRLMGWFMTLGPGLARPSGAAGASATATCEAALLDSALAGGAPILWAKKKKRKAAPAPKPVEKKKAPRKPAVAPKPRKRSNENWAMKAEKAIGDWFSQANFEEYTRKQWARLGLLVTGLVVVLLIFSFSAGGYFIFRRGWGELIILYLVVLGMLFSLSVAGRMSRLAIAEMGLFGAYGLWILLSVTWSVIPTNSFHEFLRAALYMAGFALFYLFMSRREWLPWLGHMFVAIAFIVAVAALKTKIFPDPAPFDFDARLSWPLTYWNTVALLMVMAFPISLRAAARKGAGLLMRVLQGAAMFMLLTVLFFTFSRAGYAFLGLALAVYLLFAVDRLRALLQAGLALLWTGAVVAACYAFLPAMKALSPSMDDRVSQGHSLGVLLVFLFAGAIGSQVFAWWLDQKIEITVQKARQIGYGLAIAGATVVLVAGTAFMIKQGGPVAFVRNQIDSLSSTQKSEAAATAEERLFSTQTERPQEYKVSLGTFADHPLTGTGAATWEVSWLKNRPGFTDSTGKVYDVPVKNGHSIFFDALAELGIVGAVLLAGFIIVFFVNSIRDLRFLGRSQHREIYGAFFAACSALILHSLMDWDWQMPIIFLSFFFFAGGLLRYGAISRSVAAGADSGQPEEPEGLKVDWSARNLLSWKTPVTIGCAAVMFLTAFGMLSQRNIERDSDLIQAANQLTSQNDNNGAEAKFVELEPTAARAHFYNPLDAQSLKDEAVANERQALFLSSQNKPDQAQQKFNQAVNLWNEALDREPDNYKIYIDLGVYYLETRQIDKAAEYTRKARELNPYESKVLGNLETEIRKSGGTIALGY